MGKRAQAKKEAAKAKGGKKKVEPTAQANGTSNGSAPNSKPESKEATPAPVGNNGLTLTYEEELCLALEEEARLATEARSCTGVLGIHPLGRERSPSRNTLTSTTWHERSLPVRRLLWRLSWRQMKIDNFSVTFYGKELLQDTKLELSVGNRHGHLLL